MDITIFIRAYNEERWIKQCLEAIFHQETVFSYEVLLLDSESSDRTVEIAKQYSVKIHSIPRVTFSYSKALNFGVEKAAGRFFVPLSAHAVPANAHWLQWLVEALQKDESIAAAYSRQIAWPYASLPEQRSMTYEFSDSNKVLTPSDFQNALRQKKDPYKLLQFSNSSACIRRSIATLFPFRELPFAEDRAVALDVIKAGYSIAYVPESIVQHLHDPSFNEFRTIARKATVATTFIRKQAALSHTEFLWWQLLKLILVVPYIALQILKTLIVSGRPARWREIRYYIAQIGTCLGKVEGMVEAGKIKI